MKYVLYILQCADGTLYTGITNDLEKRLIVHAEGKGSKYVRSRLPFKLIYQIDYPDKSAALVAEIQMKKLSREQKLKLVGF